MDMVVETLNDICRICLKQDETVVNNMDDWVEIVEVISQIKICLNEEYPEKICDECMQQLIAANEIRNLIIQSNAYFVKSETEMMDFVQIKGDEKGFDEITEDGEGFKEVASEHKELLDFTVLEEVLVEEQDLETPEVIEIIDRTPYRCCICDEGYFGYQELESHCADIHNKELVTKEDFETTNDIFVHCPVCEKDFNSVENTNRHRTCGDCSKHFATSESLLVHIQKKNCLDENRPKSINVTKARMVKQFGCCKCPELFATEDACKSHYDLKHPNDTYVGSDRGLFSCKLCSAPFLAKGDLQKHEKAPRIKTYVCDQCNEQFPSFPKYKQHIETVHDGTQEFGCDECDKVYDRLESLRYHKYMHHNEKNNRLCPDCGKVFKKKVSFIEHRNIHLGLRPHVCALCQNGFTSTGALRTHMRSHTGAKPFKCKFCPKRYSHYSDMKRHSYSHTGDYPFVCEKCDKGFAKRSALKCHEATHENR